MPTLIDAFPPDQIAARRGVSYRQLSARTEQLTPTMRRIRFSGKRLQRYAVQGPGQHVRLQVAGAG